MEQHHHHVPMIGLFRGNLISFMPNIALSCLYDTNTGIIVIVLSIFRYNLQMGAIGSFVPLITLMQS